MTHRNPADPTTSTLGQTQPRPDDDLDLDLEIVRDLDLDPENAAEILGGLRQYNCDSSSIGCN